VFLFKTKNGHAGKPRDEEVISSNLHL